MSQAQSDPLRFLKPRKKNFHLVNQNTDGSFTILNSLLTNQQNSILSISQTLNQNILNQNEVEKQACAESQSQTSREASTMKNNLIYLRNLNDKQSNRKYNPLKYFSSDIQQYLLKKNPSAQKCNNQREKDQLKLKQNTKPKLKDHLTKAIETDRINDRVQKVDQQKTQLKDDTDKKQVRGKDKIKNQYQTSFLNNNILQANSYSINQVKNEHQLSDLRSDELRSLHQQSKQSGLNPKNFNSKEIGFNQQNLKECQICRRSFNSDSYDKHVKVCQKVFFKKRKQFSSEKQRSLSKKK